MCLLCRIYLYKSASLSLSLTRWMASLSLSLSRVLCAKCCAYFCASRLSRVSFVKEARAVCSFVFLFFFEEEVLRRISKQTLCPVERERERERDERWKKELKRPKNQKKYRRLNKSLCGRRDEVAICSVFFSAARERVGES